MMDLGLFNMSDHIVVIKYVPSAIHVCVPSPSICIFLAYMHTHLESSRPTLLVHSQPERKDLSRQRGSSQQALLLMQ